MPELIAAFQKEYPGVDVELAESSNDVLQKYLLGETALTAAQAKAADLQADDSINGFDLAVLRQLLTKVA